MNASPLYRVESLGHRMHGQIVDADNVTECDRCLGQGEVWYTDDVYRPCPVCRGLGVVLGYSSGGQPTRVVLVEAAPVVAGPGEEPGHATQAEGTEPPAPRSGTYADAMLAERAK